MTRRKRKPQEQLDSLKAGLVKALEHPDCVRNQHGDYLYPENALRRIENVLIKHTVTTGAWLLNNNIEKKKGRKRSTLLDTYEPATVKVQLSTVEKLEQFARDNGINPAVPAVQREIKRQVQNIGDHVCVCGHERWAHNPTKKTATGYVSGACAGCSCKRFARRKPDLLDAITNIMERKGIQVSRTEVKSAVRKHTDR